jgi:hypothetical protein
MLNDPFKMENEANFSYIQIGKWAVSESNVDG